MTVFKACINLKCYTFLSYVRPKYLLILIDLLFYQGVGSVGGLNRGGGLLANVFLEACNMNYHTLLSLLRFKYLFVPFHIRSLQYN